MISSLFVSRFVVLMIIVLPNILRGSCHFFVSGCLVVVVGGGGDGVCYWLLVGSRLWVVTCC